MINCNKGSNKEERAGNEKFKYMFKNRSQSEFLGGGALLKALISGFFGCFGSKLYTFKNTAFTLAEVLITLGIIGVIAAITIPALMTNIAKRQAISKLTKAYAEISQAYKMSYNDLSEPTADEANVMGGKSYYDTYWAPYIKSSQRCTDYRFGGYSSIKPWFMLNGTMYPGTLITEDERYGTAFLTSAGVLYMIRVISGAAHEDGSYDNDATVLIDINGGKLPNTFGKDVFLFVRDHETGTLKTKCQSSSDAGINASCSKQGNGICCSEKIRRAGWKMDSTYPW